MRTLATGGISRPPSGGANSFLGPLLLYDPIAIETAYPARAPAFAVAIAGESCAMQLLKRRLLRAEARQRMMAERDPLTALDSPRSFDAALEHRKRLSKQTI